MKNLKQINTTSTLALLTFIFVAHQQQCSNSPAQPSQQTTRQPWPGNTSLSAAKALIASAIAHSINKQSPTHSTHNPSVGKKTK